MIAILVRVLGPRHRKHVAILLGVAVVCVLVGAWAYAVSQGRPFTTGLYWAIVTATTVGYGDVTPDNGAGRVIAVLVMLTAIPLLAAVFALLTGGAVAARIGRILAMHTSFPEGTYRLVIGMNPTVPAILDELVHAGVSVVLVADADVATVPPEVHLIQGDPTAEAALAKAKPQGAEQALITGQSDGDVLVSSVLVRRLAPDLRIAALVSSSSVRQALADLGIQQTVSAHDLIAAALAKSLETPHAADMLGQLIESDTHKLIEVEAGPDLVGKPLSTVRDERSGLVLGLVHGGNFTLGLAEDPTVQSGDSLLLAEQHEADRIRRRH